MTRESGPKAAPQIITAKCDHHQPTPPVRLSLSLRRLLIEHFDAAVLYELAWLKQHDSPGMIARARLSDASVDQLADMLTAGRKPTLGWWTRNTTVAA